MTNLTIINEDISKENNEDCVEVGTWYWVSDINYDQTPTEWLGCVIHVGSNYVEISGPSIADNDEHSRDSSYEIRVHFNDFYNKLRREYSPNKIIAEKTAFFEDKANVFLMDIRQLTARLGVSQAVQISSESKSLAVLNGSSDLAHYELSLKEAKEIELPTLFKKVKAANSEMCKWLKASSLPMQALSKGMTDSLKTIDDRIFNIALYAGLSEKAEQCCEGEPADMFEKLHIMQRMLYMDEECLLGYRSGGFEFTEIHQFDAWLSEPVNRDRILPFPRCIVAMRVRRNKKERDWDGSIGGIYSNIRLGITDKFTFLYVRNGDQIARITCDLDFDELIFPDKSIYDPSVAMMAEISSGVVRGMITKNDFDFQCSEYLREKALYEQWENDFPEALWEKNFSGQSRWHANSYRGYEHRNINPYDSKNYHCFDSSSVYYDEMLASVSDVIKKYNRIATIIQGLFDRSDALHPHPPVKTWISDDFASVVELVYDGTRSLMYGDAPDIQAYIDSCNESINENSVLIGQELAWGKKEAEKECRRIDNDYRNKSEYRPKIFHPYGNPGPGYLAKPSNWNSKSRVAKFSWHRERCRDYRWNDEPILTTISVPANELFNVSAYKSGDFRRFFQDPRTRALYLKWAGMFVAAEEYLAGNLKLQEPS